jgi:glycine/D-amino acid oxidase-like deaminating enzyme
VLEANFVGYGASGRNGGLMSPLPAPVWLLTADNSSDHAWAVRVLNAKLHALGAHLADQLPDSQVSPCTLQLQAVGRITGSALHRLAGLLARIGVGQNLTFEAHRGGKPTLELPAYTVQPYRLVRALAARAASQGARICEHVAVEAIEEAPGGAILRLAGGRQVRARCVIVCTNGYTGSIAVRSRPRAKVLRNYMLATEPLDAEAVARLGNGGAFTVELNKSYIFYRLHEGRLVYGGIETFLRTPPGDFDVPAWVRPALERHLAHSLPWCKDLRIATDWGGRFHSTATDLPIIRHAPDTKSIVFNVGYGGTGVALTQLFAPLAAAIALDQPLADADDARLAEIMLATRFPLASLLKFGGGIAWDVISGLTPVRQ